MVLLISPEQIELESCACAQIEARGEGNRWVNGIRYLGFIRKAGYCNIKKSLPFWSWFWIVLPFHHPNQPYYRDEGFCYTTDFLLALWVILGETNYMTHSFIQLVPFLCKLLIVVGSFVFLILHCVISGMNILVIYLYRTKIVHIITPFDISMIHLFPLLFLLLLQYHSFHCTKKEEYSKITSMWKKLQNRDSAKIR